MLRYKTLIALALAVAAPALAGPKTDHGEVDGQKFEYTTELKANGVIHFAGLIQGSGERFALDLSKNGHVEGNFGETAVQYDVAKKLRDKVAADLGEGPAMADATLRK